MSPDRTKFFSRQILVPSIGPEGLERLSGSSVLVIGLGGLGAPASLQLACSGVGRVGLLDFDKVELTNLHRQTTFTLSDIGRFKTEATKEFLEARVPDLKVEIFTRIFDSNLSAEFLNSWDIVLDCTDTVSAKYWINDLCVSAGKPFVMASLYRTSAQFALFSSKPCYRCVYPNLEEVEIGNCVVGGVLGTLSTIAGAHQAALAIRYLLGPDKTPKDRLFQLEWDSPLYYETVMHADPNCSCCGSKRENSARTKIEIGLEEYLSEKRNPDVLLIDVRESEERSSRSIPDSIFFPLSEMEKGNLPDLPKESTLILICESGIRSKKAVTILSPHFSRVYSLSGGRRALLLGVDSL